MSFDAAHRDVGGADLQIGHNLPHRIKHFLAKNRTTALNCRRRVSCQRCPSFSGANCLRSLVHLPLMEG